MEREVVSIYDTSLRDGLRNSGVTMTLTQKLQFAQQLELLKVDAIEVGYGGPSQVETMRQLAGIIDGPLVFGLSRVNLKDVDRVLQSLQGAKKPGVNIFHPVSDDFLRRAKKSPQQAIEGSVAAVRHAKQHVDHVVFSAQDASRADLGYLTAVCAAVIAAGATCVSVADSVSFAVPAQFGQFCHEVRTRTAGGENVTWSVHCHNEMGLAVANSLAAVENGFRQVECTLDGIGEGQGNTRMQSVVNALTQRADAFASVTTHLAVEQFAAAGHLLAEARKG
jgi:2-isopropylmalate synthase